jgi:hypothetical protein
MLEICLLNIQMDGKYVKHFMIVGLQYVKHFMIVELRYVKHFMIVDQKYICKLIPSAFY